MKQFKFFINIIFLILPLVSWGCKPGNDLNGQANKTASSDIIIMPEGTGSFKETALFLGGLPIETNSAYYKLTTTSEYAAFKRSVDKSWEEFFSGNLRKIEEWRRVNLENKSDQRVFYPFSGPDILNALAFYPGAGDIVMFGLEPAGSIPDLSGISVEKILPGLKALLPTINFVLDHAFFVTTDMAKNVGKTPLSGITAIMVFFLARDGYQVLNIESIHLDEKSELHRGVKSRGVIDGVEIIFSRGKGRPLQRARYFQINIADGSRQLKPFIGFLDSHGPWTTIIKSASYLMHNDSFSRIRDFILSQSISIIQDDSGIPYRYFSKNDAWEVRLFGKYHRPLPVFKERFQEELRMDCERTSSGNLPFVYGYGYGYEDMTYHLLLAIRRGPLSPLVR